MSTIHVDPMERLRRANPVPEPSIEPPLGPAERRLRAAILDRPLDAARPPRARRWGRGSYLAVGFAALVLAGGALAGARWVVDDLAAPGGPGQEFVAGVTEAGPRGDISRPPLYSELPSPRPGMRFAEGVSYWRALRELYAARAAGERAPAGVELVEPLPAGKVVVVGADGRTTLDAAAPLGYDPATGLVIAGLTSAPQGIARALPACEVVLPDRPSPDCVRDQRQPLVREVAAGRWVNLPPERSLPIRVVGNESLSILDRPATPEDRLPARALAPPATLVAIGGADPDSARRVLSRSDLRAWVMSARGGGVCLYVQGSDGVGRSTCSDRSTLVTFGAIPLGFQLRGEFMYAGVVGDGVTGVSYPGGERTPIENNVFAIRVPQGIKAVQLDGPAGGYRIVVFR